MKHLSSMVAFASPVILIAACAGTTAGTLPDDMSATNHRAAAAADERRAERHHARYDPQAAKRVTRRSLARDRTGFEFEFPESTYNPTTRHLADSADLREHAAEHERAARALESFTRAECKELPATTRALCPLLAVVVHVEDVAGGARLEIANGVPIRAVLAHMRCHHAFALERHERGMDACPLYLRDIDIHPDSDGRSVLITSKDAATIRRIRERAVAHAGTAGKGAPP